MNMLEKYQHLARMLGWTMLHSIWQIGLVYLIFLLLRALLNRNNKALYWTCLLAMSSCLLWTVLTFTKLYTSVSEITEIKQAALVDSPAISPNPFTMPEQPPEPVEWALIFTWLENYADWFGWIWCAGALLFSLRLAGGYWLSQRLRKESQAIMNKELQQHLQVLKQRLGIQRTVQLLENQHIQAPLTLGFWKPVVLFPVGLALQLSPAQVEVLLLHELAHIRRYDYVINIFQLTLEVCFFYHPLFRLISREASLRREYACDDLVLRFDNNPWLYANTLTEIKLLSFHPQPPFIMSAIGNSNFSTRIQRIMGYSPDNGKNSVSVFVFLLLTAGLITTCWPVSSRANSNEEQMTGISPATTSVSAPDTVTPGVTLIRTQAVVKSNPAPPPMPAVVVEMSNRHVLYVGLDNPLRIMAAGIPANEISVKLVGPGKIEGLGIDYKVQVNTPGDVNINVYRRQKNQEILLQTLPYQVKNIPDPTPLFAGFHSGKISVAEFLKNPTLNLQFDKVEFEVPYEIVGFDITILPKDQDPQTFASYSPTPCKEAIEMLSQLLPGSAIYIDDIKIKIPGDSGPRNVGGIVLKIVQ